jgi:alkylation response protein AidB-like acyl-CoA dehydrogenase
LFVSLHIGLALGIARRALDEITMQEIEKGRGLPPSPLQTHPHFQLALGKAKIELASARATATYVTEVALRVTSVAFQAAGGGALFDANPLQRCYRDISAARQHFNVSQTLYRALGRFKLNQPDANPML